MGPNVTSKWIGRDEKGKGVTPSEWLTTVLVDLQRTCYACTLQPSGKGRMYNIVQSRMGLFPVSPAPLRMPWQ